MFFDRKNNSLFRLNNFVIAAIIIEHDFGLVEYFLDFGISILGIKN